MHIRNKNRKPGKSPSWRMDAQCRKILDRLLAILRRIYQVAGVISTLTIFTAVVLFIAGKMGLETASDDDLIMRDIRKQIPENLTIADITVEDIHGFGNESLIVLADDKDRYYDEDSRNSKSANQLLVFDKVENSILNQVYNFAGYGSNYKLSYMFSLSSEYLESELAGYMIEFVDIVELTGDTSRELVVRFMMCPPGTSGRYEIGIFSYSFDKQAYDLIGTYPPAGGYSLDEGERKPAPTVFHSETAEHYNFYDKSVCFQLEEGSDFTNSFLQKGMMARSLSELRRSGPMERAGVIPTGMLSLCFNPSSISRQGNWNGKWCSRRRQQNISSSVHRKSLRTLSEPMTAVIF